MASNTKPTSDPIPASKVPPTPANDELKEKDCSDCETGGLSEFRKTDEGISRVVEKVQNEIKTHIKTLTKEKLPEKLEVVGYRMHVVLGYMYFAKIKIPGKSFVQAKILESPAGEISLQSVTETKTDEDEKDFFKLPKNK